MFGIGTSEFVVIILVAVLVLGPEQLPKIMRTMTKIMSDFRRISTDFQRTLNLEANQEEYAKQQTAILAAVTAEKPKKKKKKIAETKAPVEDSASTQSLAHEAAADAHDTTAEQTTTTHTKQADLTQPPAYIAERESAEQGISPVDAAIANAAAIAESPLASPAQAPEEPTHSFAAAFSEAISQPADGAITKSSSGKPPTPEGAHPANSHAESTSTIEGGSA